MSFYDMFSKNKKNKKRARPSSSGSNQSIVENIRSRVYGLVPAIGRWLGTSQDETSDSSDDDGGPPSKRKCSSPPKSPAPFTPVERSTIDSEQNNDNRFTSTQTLRETIREDRNTSSRRVSHSTPGLSPMYDDSAEESVISVAVSDTVDRDTTYKAPHIASTSGSSIAAKRTSIFKRDTKPKDLEKPAKIFCTPANDTPRDLRLPRFRPSLYSSPFYPGPTMYGGASAYNFNNRSIIEHKVVKPPEPLEEDNSALSSSTRRILDLLENYPSPLLDARRIPVFQKPDKSQELNKPLQSTSKLNPYKTQELHVASVASRLRLKQRSRLMETNKLARQIMASRSSTQPELISGYKIKDSGNSDLEPEYSKERSGKIKTFLTKANRGVDQFSMPEPVQLPTAVLQIDKNNLPKFSITTPAVSDNSMFSPTPQLPQDKRLTTSPLIQSNVNTSPSNAKSSQSISPMFKFACPDPVHYCIGPVPLASIGLTITSDATSAVTVSAMPIPAAPLLVASPEAEGKKSEEKDWKCDDCWIKNKSSVDKCAACGASKPGSKKHAEPAPLAQLAAPASKLDDKLAAIVRAQKASKWECPSCLTSNDNKMAKCQCCDMEREGPSKEITPKPFAFPKQSNITFKFGIDPKEQEKNLATKTVQFGLASSPANAQNKNSGDDKTNKEEDSVVPSQSSFSFGISNAATDRPAAPAKNAPFTESSFATASLANFGPGFLAQPKTNQDTTRVLSTPIFSFMENSPTKTASPVKSSAKESTDTETAPGITSAEPRPISFSAGSLASSDWSSANTGVASSTGSFSFGSMGLGAPASTAGVQGSLASSSGTSASSSAASYTGGFSFGSMRMAAPVTTAGAPKSFASGIGTSASSSAATYTGGFSFGSMRMGAPATIPGAPPPYSSSHTTAAAVSSNNIFGGSVQESAALSAPSLQTAASLFNVSSNGTSVAPTAPTFSFGTTNKEAMQFGKTFNNEEVPFGVKNNKGASMFGATNSYSIDAPGGSGGEGLSGSMSRAPGAPMSFGGSGGGNGAQLFSFGTSAGSFNAPGDSVGVTTAAQNVFAPPASGSGGQQSGTFAGVQQAAPMFGSQSATSMFNDSQPTIFGGPTQAQPSAFEAAQTQNSTFGASTQGQASAFGAPTQNQTPAFGTPAQNLASAFGSPAQNQTPSFGVPTQNQSPAFGIATQSQPSAFGAPTLNQTPSFGAPTQSQAPAFGAPSQSQNSFGAPIQNPTPAFGSPGQNQAVGFGAPTQSSQMSAFGSLGASQPGAFQSPTASAFGAPPPVQQPTFGAATQPSPSGNMFNFGLQSSTSQGVFGFGQQQQQPQQHQPQQQQQPAAFSFGGGNAMGGLNTSMGGMLNQPMEPQFSVGSAPTQRRIRKAMRRTQR